MLFFYIVLQVLFIEINCRPTRYKMMKTEEPEAGGLAAEFGKRPTGFGISIGREESYDPDYSYGTLRQRTIELGTNIPDQGNIGIHIAPSIVFEPAPKGYKYAPPPETRFEVGTGDEEKEMKGGDEGNSYDANPYEDSKFSAKYDVPGSYFDDDLEYNLGYDFFRLFDHLDLYDDFHYGFDFPFY